MTFLDVLLFLFLFCTAFFAFLVVFYQAWRTDPVGGFVTPLQGEREDAEHSGAV